MLVPAIKLNDQNTIPQLGFGVWQIENEEADKAVKNALEVGYRQIDTAKIYKNEQGVGLGVRQSGINRQSIFITTKVWNDAQGFDATLNAFDESLARLQMDYVDLYLIHWPMPSKNLFVETWQALIRLQQEKRTKSIGVCNFRIQDLQYLIDKTGIVPAVNQIELHPQFQQAELRAFHKQHNIKTQAWSPLARGRLTDNPILVDIAKAHNKSVAQIILRWHIEIGNIIIPKTVSPKRMVENFNIFDFALSQSDHDKITTLDKIDGREGPNPDDFTGL